MNGISRSCGRNLRKNELTINIAGAGAVGSYLACRLEQAGRPVRLISCFRGAGEVASISREGFLVHESPPDAEAAAIESESVRIRPQVFSIGEEIPGCDVLILCVKSHQIGEVMPRLRFEFRAALTLVNGYGFQDTLKAACGNRPVWIGSVHISVRRRNPNHVFHFGGDRIQYAALDRGGSADGGLRERLDSTLTGTGIRTTLKRDVKKMMFKKLLINSVLNPLTAIWRIPKGELLMTEARRAEVERLIGEALLVFGREGMDWDRDYARKLIEATIVNTPASSTSMAEDIRFGRGTEIDEINGALLRLAAGHGLELPGHREIVRRIRDLEAGRSPG